MAKKKSNRKKRSAASSAPAVKYDDEKYGDVRFSLTYDYGELALSKAASYLGGQKARLASLALSMVCLVLMIVVLIADSHNLGPAMVLLLVSLVGTTMTTNWHSMQVRYARKSSLGYEGSEVRRHVVVTDEAAYVVEEDGSDAKYALSELRSLSSDDDGLLAGFGNRRYVYAPAAAMSASRYQELVHFLEAAKK